MCDLWESPEDREILERMGFPEPNYSICEDCGQKCHIGDWGICQGKFGGHQRMAAYHPFRSFVDVMMDSKPIEITSARQWEGEMKKRGLYVRSKYDRERRPPSPDNTSINRHYNEAVRAVHGGNMNLSHLRDDD
jgi:hypothetical protein